MSHPPNESPSASSPEPAASAEGRWPVWVETWVLPYVREPVLWPVLIAILGHVVVLFALGALNVWRGESWTAAVLSVAFTVGSVGWEYRVMRRPGPIAAWIALTWLVSIGLVVLSVRTGFL